MNVKLMSSYRDRLRDISSRARRDVVTVREQALGPIGQGDGALSNAPMHLGDMGTETYLQELNAALLENEEYLLTESLAAIQRIDAGDFGNCESCGAPIARERLDALPYARHCTACADQLRPGPAVNLDAGRPVIQTEPVRGASASSRKTRDSAAPSSGTSTARDTHAAGTAGGGTAVGGLAGTNQGSGDPENVDLERATASGDFDAREGADDEPEGGPHGGAVGGTPAGKRAKRGKQSRGASGSRNE